MKRIISIIVILITLIVITLYFLDGLEYTEDEKEWCKEHQPLLTMKTCAKEFGY
jgi:hypothetical protein